MDPPTLAQWFSSSHKRFFFLSIKLPEKLGPANRVHYYYGIADECFFVYFLGNTYKYVTEHGPQTKFDKKSRVGGNLRRPFTTECG